MQTIQIPQSTVGTVANISANVNRLAKLLPTGARSQQTPPAIQTPIAPTAPIAPTLPASESLVPTEAFIREKFIAALHANHRTWQGLSAATQTAIESGYGREDCIRWGLEAGLNKDYVRSTVSRLFIELVGRVKAAGAGRKRSVTAVRFAKLALRYHKGDFVKAKALLLAARRALEAMEKQAADSAVK